jgi:hypothetical protein
MWLEWSKERNYSEDLIVDDKICSEGVLWEYVAGLIWLKMRTECKLF